jgi:RNA polymerase sigma factor (sigma-70 family)
MQDLDDLTLLREYAAHDSEAAFAELVSRRIGFVYSAALRQVRDPHLAGEITQAVFIILAQKAGRISDKTILCGWLFKTTRYAAIAQARDAAKRSLRTATIEKEFQMQSEIQASAPDALWEKMSPLLDEALATLGETDRQAVLLRFFENKSLAEVGSHLGTGEDTARKRVARALEKLHRYFTKRGVSSTTAILAGAISANSVQAAPVALAKTISVVALSKGAAATASTLTLVKGALKAMTWSKVKMGIYTVNSSTNIGGYSLPLTFNLKVFVPAYSGVGTVLYEEYNGTISNVSAECSLTNFIPEVTGMGLIGDTRFVSVDGIRKEQFNYETNRWLSTNEAEAMPGFSNYVVMERLLALSRICGLLRSA